MIPRTTALVVEDEYIIALEVQRILETAGATAIVAGPVVAESVAPGETGSFDIALVAVSPDNSAQVGLCRELADRGVALVILTSSSEHELGHPEFPGVPVVLKPFTDEHILGAATKALESRTRPLDPAS